MNILIVGGGFIGKAVAQNCLSKSINVKILDRNHAPNEFSQSLDWIIGDYHNHDVLCQALSGVDIVFHLVSSTIPSDQNISPTLELNENVVGAVDFLEACIESGVKRVLFASSASVYGVQKDMPINESAQTNPISAHGIQKLMIEKYLLLAKFREQIDIRIARIANPYGPGQNLYGRQGFVAIALGKVIKDSSINLSNHGENIRDFIFIDDLAEAMVRLSLRDNASSVMNIGSGRGYSLKTVLSTIKQLTNYSVNTIDVHSNVTDIFESVLDVELMKSELGFIANTSLEDGITQTILANDIDLKQS